MVGMLPTHTKQPDIVGKETQPWTRFRILIRRAQRDAVPCWELGWPAWLALRGTPYTHRPSPRSPVAATRAPAMATAGLPPRHGSKSPSMWLSIPRATCSSLNAMASRCAGSVPTASSPPWPATGNRCTTATASRRPPPPSMFGALRSMRAGVSMAVSIGMGPVSASAGAPGSGSVHPERMTAVTTAKGDRQAGCTSPVST